MHTLTHNFSLQQSERFLACWDCQNSLFRTFAKFYVSKMTPFHAASEALSQRHMKDYASESVSFSFCSTNVQAENVTQCCLEKLCVRTTERIVAVNWLPERFQANREKLYASEMRSYIRQTTLILHRQPFTFPPIESYALPRPGARLCDYLEMHAAPPTIPNYIYHRLDGKYRDLPEIYHPQQREAVNLFTNYRRDRSLFLVEDPRCPRGVRPFSVREVANLHGFDASYQFLGSLGETYDMVVDSVLPPVAHAIGQAANAYFQSIPHLATVPRALGYREVASSRGRQEDVEEALRNVLKPEPIEKDTTQLALW